MSTTFPTKKLVPCRLLIILTFLLWCVSATSALAYSIDDVEVVYLSETGKGRDAQVEYVIGLYGDIGYLVSGTNVSRSQLETSVRNTGFVGDAGEVLDMALDVDELSDTQLAQMRALRIQLLKATLQKLQTQFSLLKERYNVASNDVSYLGTTPWCAVNWQRPLRLGDEGDDVVVLQKFLNSRPGIRVADHGDGAPGFETRYFGPKTAAALTAFQEQHRTEILSPLGTASSEGYFGALTQKWIERLCANESASSGTHAIPLDRLQRQTTGDSCYSGNTPIAAGAKVNGYYAPNGLYVSIENGYFRCEAGQWQPHELDA